VQLLGVLGGPETSQVLGDEGRQQVRCLLLPEDRLQPQLLQGLLLAFGHGHVVGGGREGWEEGQGRRWV